MNQSNKVEQSVWVFYLVALLSLSVEGSLVELFGPIEFSIIYLLVGAVFSTYHLLATKTERRPLGPILGFCKWAYDHSPALGYFLTVFIAGAPGVAIIWTKLKHPKKVLYTAAAVPLFVLIWGPLWYGLFTLIGINKLFSFDLVDVFQSIF